MAEKKQDTIKYTTLSEADRVVLARDALRARESDHFRLTLVDQKVEPSAEARLEQLAAEIERLRGVVSALERDES